MRSLKITFFLLITLQYIGTTNAQYVRAYVGTDIPMQYLFGVNYQQGKYISAEASIGYIGIPYNGDLYKVIKVPEKHQANKEFLMETTDDGYVIGLGLNGHYKKWYGGVFTQRMELHASATYQYILGSELFQEELNADQKILLNNFLDQDINLGGFNVNLQDIMRLTTETWQLGLKVGRRFKFKNPRWEFRTELALSRNIKASNKSDYDETLFDQVKVYYNILKNNPELVQYYEDLYGIDIPTDIALDNLLNFESKESELNDWFHKYAYIPTLNFHVSYLVFVPKKVKEKQEEIDRLKSEDGIE